ncbi:uncharacterized protein B0T23DRAFT_379778 [Neurospora hispaniola]|uniref:Uncharacterized protein n=1 Tax=Neurospora hispaniola TaxID=588809 RepID=A0AAJ0MRB1_9PEZI|nr:hypothetical protein B0T23DRAFT_379778 [Neurospora hispaniola]
MKGLKFKPCRFPGFSTALDVLDHPPARLPFALAGCCSALLRSRPLWPPPSPRSLSLTAVLPPFESVPFSLLLTTFGSPPPPKTRSIVIYPRPSAARPLSPLTSAPTQQTLQTTDVFLFVPFFFFLSGVCYREGGSHSSCPPPNRRILRPPSQSTQLSLFARDPLSLLRSVRIPLTPRLRKEATADWGSLS